MFRRQISTCCATAMMIAAVLGSAPPAGAADFPNKPVTVVVGYAAGGPTDVLMRAIAPRLSSAWQQPVVVDNRPGANEILAAQLVSKAPPDGHTLLLSTEAPLTQNQFLYRKLNYNPETDFSPVTLLLKSPLALVVQATTPANTLQEFIALARTRATTRPLSYGSAGTGGVLHLPMAMFAKQKDLSMTHVPYKGLAPLINDLLAGHLDAAWMAVAGAAPHVRDGKLKALVVDAPTRSRSMPRVPLLTEVDATPIHASFIFAIQAPAGTPATVNEKIATAIREIVADAEFREKHLEPYGFFAITSTPAELAAYLAEDRPRQAERIKASGAALD